MTIGELIEALREIAEMPGCSLEMPVTFGSERELVAGGVVGRNDDAPELNLAPISFSGRPYAF